MTPAERVYRLLLMLYPRAHRAEYGDLMLTHFCDQLRDAHKAGRGVSHLYRRTLLDAARTIPAEHLALAKESIMDAAHPVRPLPWWQIALVILPGLTLLPTLPSGDGTGYVFAAIVLVMLIAGVVWQRDQVFPAWGLLLLGLVMVVVAVALAAAIGSLIPGWSLIGALLLGGLIAALLAVASVVVVRHLRSNPLPPALRWLLPLMLALALTSGTLGAVIAPAASPLTWAQAPTILFGAGWEAALLVVLLIPVTLGLPLARRYGLAALAFVVGGLYPYYVGIMDPAYAIGLHTDSHLLTLLVTLAAPALMLVVGPLWMLRAASARWRALGLLIPFAAALLIGEGISLAVRPYADGLFWLRGLLQALNLWLIVATAALLYRTAPEVSAPALEAESPTS